MMYLTFAAAFMLSTIAAYYSIVGLTTIFAGAFWPIVIMGIALELAKLVTTSWLYQNWRRASWLLKTYLTIAVIMLMIITSMGIFGFLAKSHIDSTQGNKSNATDIATLTTQENIAKARLDYLLARAKDPSAASPSLDRQIQETQKELSRLSKAKAPLLQEENRLVADVGPLVYIAEIFYDDSTGSVDRAVRLVIMLIMFVFDPLAILLLIAANTLLKEKTEKILPNVHELPPSTSNTKTHQENGVGANVIRSQDKNAKVYSSTNSIENDRQLTTILMTNNDVVAAFKYFFNRAPEEKDNIKRYVGINSFQLLEVFCNSPEFLSRSGADKLILRAAKKIEDLKNNHVIN